MPQETNGPTVSVSRSQQFHVHTSEFELKFRAGDGLKSTGNMSTMNFAPPLNLVLEKPFS